MEVYLQPLGPHLRGPSSPPYVLKDSRSVCYSTSHSEIDYTQFWKKYSKNMQFQPLRLFWDPRNPILRSLSPPWISNARGLSWIQLLTQTLVSVRNIEEMCILGFRTVFAAPRASRLGSPRPSLYSKARGQSIIQLHTQKLVNVHNLEENIQKMLISANGAVFWAPGPLHWGPVDPPETQRLGVSLEFSFSLRN